MQQLKLGFEGQSIDTSPQEVDARVQVFTPHDVAILLMTHLSVSKGVPVRLLDAGAGAGALTEAFLEVHRDSLDSQISLDLIEVDQLLAGHLLELREHLSLPDGARFEVYAENFLRWGTDSLDSSFYTHIVMNPPYARLAATSEDSKALRGVGISAPNTYAAFIWLGLRMLAPGGQLAAIVPRSFCNGKLFRGFREEISRRYELLSITSFPDRKHAFARDAVLQETIIIAIRRPKENPMEDTVALRWVDHDSATITVPRTRIVETGDPNFVIRVPEDARSAQHQCRDQRWNPLLAPGVDVSTGSVVDFRTESHLSPTPTAQSVPLITSTSFHRTPASDRQITPKLMRYLAVSEATRNHVYPPGNYIVVRRVAPREQRPRIKAYLIRETDTLKFGGVAFENHLNVIHRGRKGLSEEEAHQILDKLADPIVEAQFSELSGTTQVNVADIRDLKFPFDNDDVGKRNPSGRFD